MLFAFPVLFASVFLLNLEIIIRAVIIKDLIIPLPQEMAVLIANVNHFFTLLGKMFFTPYGKEFFTYLSKQIFTS